MPEHTSPPAFPQAYPPDNYTEPYIPGDPAWQKDPDDWRESIKGHPCFDPKKVRFLHTAYVQH